MTKAGGVIDVVRAQKARRLLRHVINLIGNAARGEKESDPPRGAVPNATRDAAVGFIPGDAPKSLLAALAQKGEREASQFAQLRIVHLRQRGNIFQQTRVQGGHRIEAQQIQPRHTEMDAFNGPIMEARHAEGATVANALAQDLPRVGEIVAVLPNHAGHVAKMFRLGLAQTKRHSRFKAGLPVLLDSVRTHRPEGGGYLTGCRPLKVSSATPDLSSSPNPSAIILSNCFFEAVATGKFSPCSLARRRAMPESLAACAAEKKQVWSLFCMSSPRVCSTRELAPVCEKTSRNRGRSKPSAAPKPRPSARPAVLMFMTMLTSALTCA